jgi:hypothetical protein
MNRDDIIRIAREAGAGAWGDSVIPAMMDIERFAALVAAHEREACAEIAEETAVLYGLDNPDDYDKGCMDCAAAIRARGDV